MSTNLTKNPLQGLQPLDTLDYRGVHVEFFVDPIGHQMFALTSSGLMEFGEYNNMYRSDAAALIDDQLDTITRFREYPEFHGAKLSRFQNGDHCDVKLTYRGRIVKVYLTSPGEHPKNELVSDALEYLRTHISLLN
jgi:hypothetical protein